MKKIIYTISLLIITFGSLFYSPNVRASENKADFSVSTEQSDYQINKQKTYFDLSLPVKESIPLTIHVTNNSNESIDIQGEISPATTNLNGVVEYSQTNDELTGNQPFDINEVATLEKDIQTIPPKQTVDFVINVCVPTNDYSGVVAGGITFRDVTEKKENDKNRSMFQNKFAYSIALILHGKRNDAKTELSLQDITPEQINSRNVLTANIHNDSPNYVNKVSIDAKVIDSNKKEILSQKKENMQIAPDSVFKFPVYYEEEKMNAGTYTIQLVIKSNDLEWNLSKEFTIRKDTATKLNAADVIQNSKIKDNRMVYLLIGLVICLTILVIILYRKINSV